eukprot:3341139-Ditylum_brightwellii.AAC.1
MDSCPSSAVTESVVVMLVFGKPAALVAIPGGSVLLIVVAVGLGELSIFSGGSGDVTLCATSLLILSFLVTSSFLLSSFNAAVMAG